jgi:8-amino-7-oxononanoate synthase
MKSKESFYSALLEKKQKQNRYKQLKCILPVDRVTEEDSKPLLNFSSADFLGLSQHPFVKKTTIKYVLKWGSGSSLSRLVTSHLEQQHSLEKELAGRCGKLEGFFLSPLPSVHDLTLSPLGISGSIIFIDEAASLALFKAAENSEAKVISFSHNSASHLMALLESHASHLGPKIIVTESIFQTGGELCPLKDFCHLAKTHAALLYVDDTLSFAIGGHHGYGFAAEKRGVDIVISSLCHSNGVIAYFALTSSTLKEFLLTAQTNISSFTMLPPASLGAIEAAIELIPDMHEERARVQSLSSELRVCLHEKGLCFKESSPHIIAIEFKDDEELSSFFHHCIEEKILLQNLKATQVTKKPVLRFLITSEQTSEQIKALKERISLWTAPMIYEKALSI